MVGLTKRKVQSGRRDSEGGGKTERSLGQNTEELQKQLYRHYNETSHLNAQWRVSTRHVNLCDHPNLSFPFLLLNPSILLLTSPLPYSPQPYPLHT